MAYETLLLTREDGFAVITLNRPPANAISEELIRELNAALNELRDDATVRAPLARPLRADRLDLERAIARLSPGYRAAFVLHDVEGFDHKEVADLLGIAEGTSKSQVFKARLKLRGFLGKR
jgi:DNA-directed RNA polymerase specialized sigma24 family protein